MFIHLFKNSTVLLLKKHSGKLFNVIGTNESTSLNVIVINFEYYCYEILNVVISFECYCYEILNVVINFECYCYEILNVVIRFECYFYEI